MNFNLTVAFVRSPLVLTNLDSGNFLYMLRSLYHVNVYHAQHDYCRYWLDLIVTSILVSSNFDCVITEFTIEFIKATRQPTIT